MAFVGLFVFAELAYWLGARTASEKSVSGNCAVLVAGYPANPDGSLHPMQRMRVEVGVTAYRNHDCDRMILSGAAAHNGYVEAEVMAAFAGELGITKDHLVIEDRSRNTWQNVSCAQPYLENYDSIYIASDNLHMHRAKHYLCRQKPSWCNRIQTTGGYLPLSLVGWTVPIAIYELHARIRDFITYDQQDSGNAPFCPTR